MIWIFDKLIGNTKQFLDFYYTSNDYFLLIDLIFI